MNATLKLYLEGKQIEIPTLQYLARKEAEVKELATLSATS
jgi:hypothetical protein